MADAFSPQTNLLRWWWCLVMVTSTAALWPAFPSSMGAALEAGSGGGYSATSRQRRLLQANAGEREVTDACSCTAQLRSVESRSRSNVAKLQELQTSLDAMFGAISSLKKSLDAVSSKASKRLAAPQNYNIAFSARVGYNRPYLGETEVIVFDELVINNGDFYDPYSGKFTAPVGGLYHFETTVLSGFNATIETMMVLNGNEVARVFSGGFRTRGSGSNSVLLNMQPGDEVWVAVFFGNGDYVHGLWSTFAGYLVHSYDPLDKPGKRAVEKS